MNQKTNSVPQKPEIIQQLEKSYQIELTEHKREDAERYMHGAGYLLNEKGQIVSISFPEGDIIDTTPLEKLIDLVHLSLTRNKVKNIEPLQKLIKLEYLYLGGNLIQDISPLIQLNNITRLAIWDNPIEDITPLQNLIKLEQLYFQNTNSNAPSFLSSFPHIQEIGASDNNITTLEYFRNFTKLKMAMLDGNSIEDISILAKINKIRDLDLNNNLIKEISKDVAQKYDWLEGTTTYIRRRAGLQLFNNPLRFPPMSVIELGKDATRNYYNTAEKFGHAPLSEGRIIVVGDGSAGKSSLIDRILHNSFD
ncbi:leucine-rich repeat domain-containing protein [Hymenobacter daecheongensis]|uniref:leucine-rich repeat domain-containing protein n=1 Tax=Hymenobacter daecheongensis TaxID=496053 RepID=UPI00093539FD|nr:leucine-rich repeat domain-containing protein [Hymenobacter daecheongensis]